METNAQAFLTIFVKIRRQAENLARFRAEVSRPSPLDRRAISLTFFSEMERKSRETLEQVSSFLIVSVRNQGNDLTSPENLNIHPGHNQLSLVRRRRSAIEVARG